MNKPFSVGGASTARLAEIDATLERARAIAAAGGLEAALATGTLPARMQVTLAEGLVLGLLKQGVTKYLAIFGHGSTHIGEVLRQYDEAGVTRTFNFRNEVAMAHVATALAWQYGETPAVVTSIGPGGLQAMAGALAAASNGVGVYHIYGDETTHGEGYNMQQVPRRRQGIYGQMAALLGESYVLHTPEALRDALRRGTQTVHDPYKAGPFFLLAPINTQPATLALNLAALPERMKLPRQALADSQDLEQAAALIRDARRIVIKAGGGSRRFAAELRALAERIGAAVVLSPGSTGVLPHRHPQNMHVGGSKGSISGNFAMQNADLLIAIGTRAVCQADCSGTGYPQVRAVVNINGDPLDATHYNRTLALIGDIGAVVRQLAEAVGAVPPEQHAPWLQACAASKAEWLAFSKQRFDAPPLADAAWQRPVLTQPVAIKTVDDFAREVGAVKYFDAGDVQANGFQIVEDDAPFQTFTETGASYMGFATSGMVAAGLAQRPAYPIAFTGDGSFMMNPQALIDAVEHGTRGMIVIFDNRRMAAISSLQHAQYGREFRTSDSVAVDYVRLCSSVQGVCALWGGATREELAAALRAAHAHPGLSVVHVPVYAGEDPLAGMGAYGSWNVGNWVDEVQARYHTLGL
ncbi:MULTISPECIES: thiamine pyrophosphate-dependent enzyme [unclassified Massilia]|uniref:thiamine pyrophosphate-dependent enzyme n=1 Tax=unclassified Massilia TaxID=2609279 RepID=UPI0009E78038|nr:MULTISPECIES: thiamine pyrophosphate-dependent enzyme [unclassified Massilia]